MTGGAICEKCSGGKEYWCVLQNCEQNLFKSAGYALRNMVARRLSLFHDNVDVFMVLTAFAKQKMIENGFAPDRVQVLSALADPSAFPVASATSTTALGRYVGFVGRVSPEKGVDLLMQAAVKLPHIPFKIAGAYDPNDDVARQAPGNVDFLGSLDRDALIRFYQQSRMLVTPSRWFEGLPVVMIEAMLCAKPVISSLLGGLPDVVEGGRTGLLTPPGDVEALAAAIQELWDAPERARQFGLAGRRKAESEYSPNAFYTRLMTAYRTSLKRHPKRRLAA
jgi:glycosyltransferase involved in cell wall biosynthesis